MATDATGTPTALGIPKYNTATDPPSGKGFNAAMDALDALIAARAPKPLVSSGVKIWNNTTGAWNDPTGTADGTKFLRDDGAWAATNTVHARVAHSANQSIPNSTFTTLAFDTESLDTDSMHNTVTNNGRITFNTAGLYLILGQVHFAASGTGSRELVLQINGTTNIDDEIAVGNAGAASSMRVGGLYQAAASDYVTLVVWQNSGGALNIVGGQPYTPFLHAVRLSG